MEKFPFDPKSDKIKFVGEVAEAKLEQLKAKHGRVHTMYVPANDENTEVGVGYFKPIDRELMGAALSVSDPVQAKGMVLEATFVEGDRRILSDDEMFFSACNKVDEMMSVRRAFLKKN